MKPTVATETQSQKLKNNHMFKINKLFIRLRKYVIGR